MKILIVNTSEQTGGAAVAAKRLLTALNNNGVEAKMLVRDRSTSDAAVVELPGEKRRMIPFFLERMSVFLHLHLSKTHLWEVDTACSGNDITQLPEFKEADIIHLSWINQGMLSLRNIEAIMKSGKPIVWTMHDLWPASSICHYARGCTRFMSECRDCKLLPGGGSSSDISNKVWARKSKLFRLQDIHFVACSRWLENQAKQSALLQGMPITSIPNPIDTSVFCPREKAAAKAAIGLPKEKKVVLFVAQKVTDERKGARYLVEALNKLQRENPEEADKVVVALLGGHAEELTQQLSLPVYPLGYVSGDAKIAQIYNAADAFVLPSMEDNLPNTLMEALACGVPCIGFNVGGIPEMIDHEKNGFVAREGSVDELKQGLHWVLFEADYKQLCQGALQKVSECYSQKSVARKYIEVYNKALAQKGGVK